MGLDMAGTRYETEMRGYIGYSTGRTARMSRRSYAMAVISNPGWFGLGLSCLISEAAMGFSCEIRLKYRGFEANGRQILELLALRINPGSALTITAEGEGAENAVESITGLVGSLK